jgi:NADH dehydrogenase
MTRRLITVFGGSGFIGRHLVRRLARAGDRVNVAVRHVEEAKFLKPMGDVGQVTPVRASLTDPAMIASALAGADAVVNLVGILYERGQQSFEAIHHEGAARLAAAAKAAGARRFVQISAIGADLESDSAYQQSKARGEHAVRAAFPESVILRPSVVFGPEDDFFNRFGALALMAPVLPLIGGGHTRFQPVYVGDVADAIMKALDDPATSGKLYELGGPRVYSFRALMEFLLGQIGRKRLLVPLPFAIASIQAFFMELLPKPLLTRDQVIMLRHDNVVSADALGLVDLGIVPTAVEAIVPSYLDRFSRGGRFKRQMAA